MGTQHRLCKKRMLKSLIFLALVATVFAYGSEAPEETFVAEASFAAATDSVGSQLEVDSEAARGACVKAADASIQNVYTDVKNSQRMLNDLPDGRTCAKRNQHLIAKARRWIKTTESRLRTAKHHLTHARRTRIDWDFSFESLRPGACNPFFRSGQWQAVKRKVSIRTRQVATAQATVRSAHQNLRNTIAAAKRAVNLCKCGVMDEIRRSLAAARRATPDRKKTVLREEMVKCLVAARKQGKNANKAAAKCKSLRLSRAVIAKLALHHPVLASGVNRARCSAHTLRISRSERQVKSRHHYAKLQLLAEKRAEKATKENKKKRELGAKKREKAAKAVARERKAKAKARELKRKEVAAKARRKEKTAKARRAAEKKAKAVAKERGAKVRAERARKAKAREQSHKRRVAENRAKAAHRERKGKEHRNKAVARERKAKAAARERAQKVQRERNAKHHERVAKNRAREQNHRRHERNAKNKERGDKHRRERHNKWERSRKAEAKNKENANKRVERAAKHKNEQAQKRRVAAERSQKEKGHKQRERHNKHVAARARERHSKNVCTVHAYEHNNFHGRAHGWAVRASKQVIRMPNYGRRRGYQASSFRMSGAGCRMVQLWDEDRCHENYRDNVNIHSSVRSVKWDLNDDICAITVWANRLRM